MLTLTNCSDNNAEENKELQPQVEYEASIQKIKIIRIIQTFVKKKHEKNINDSFSFLNSKKWIVK